MGGQASSKLGLSVPLVYELKVFFNAVLPELIDNTKIHKGSREPNLAALFVRLRKRESGLRSRAERIAEPSTQELTRLKKRSRHFWQGDFIEATYCDHGPAIHTTWREGWFEQHGRSSSPRLPDGQSLRNPFSPHADLQILKAIFEQGASSVPPDRRKELGLPNLHGLQAVGHAVSESDCLFSVSSGQNTVLVGRSHLVGRQDDAHSTADEQMRVVPVSRASRHGWSPLLLSRSRYDGSAHQQQGLDRMRYRRKGLSTIRLGGRLILLQIALLLFISSTHSRFPISVAPATS